MRFAGIELFQAVKARAGSVRYLQGLVLTNRATEDVP
jgi:hypothetical protein